MDFTNLITKFYENGIVSKTGTTEYNEMLLTGCCVILSKNGLLTAERLEEAYMLAQTGRFTLNIESLIDFGTPVSDTTQISQQPCGGCGGGAVR